MVIRVEGIEGMAQLARDLKAAGEKDLTKELRKSLQRTIRPLKAAAREGALEALPASGGLAAEVAASGFTGRVSLLGKNPRVLIEGKGRQNKHGQRHDLRAMDRGRLRHPLYGRRGRWYTQLVRPGWFSLTLESKSEIVYAELLRAAQAVADKLGRG